MRRCTVYNATQPFWDLAHVRLEGWLIEVHQRTEYRIECIVANAQGALSIHGADYVRVHVPVMIDLLTRRRDAPHGTHGDGLPADES